MDGAALVLTTVPVPASAPMRMRGAAVAPVQLTTEAPAAFRSRVVP